MFTGVLIDVGLVKQGFELRIELRRADELLLGHNWKGHNGIGEKKERKKQGRRKNRKDLILDLRVTALS